MFSFNPFAGKKENFFPFAFDSSSSNSTPSIVNLHSAQISANKKKLFKPRSVLFFKQNSYYPTFTSNSSLLVNDLLNSAVLSSVVLSSVVSNCAYYLNCTLFFDSPKRTGSKDLVYVIPELLYSISSHIMGHIFALAIISNLPARISKA